MDHRDEVFGAALVPAHNPSEPVGDGCDHDQLRHCRVTTPEATADRRRPHPDRFGCQTGRPRDLVLGHMRTLHGAPATVGMTTRRRGFSTRWLGDDARFAVRPWKTSPPYREVELDPGDRMDHVAFPLVWQSEGGR